MKHQLAIITAVAVLTLTGCTDPTTEYIKTGRQQYQQGLYQEASASFQKALEAGKETPAIHNMIGICAMQQGDYDGALAAFEKGIGLAETGGESEEQKPEDTADDKSEAKAGAQEVVQEMKYNRIVCFEKKLDWQNAKEAAAAYAAEYPDDEAIQKEAAFLQTRE